VTFRERLSITARQLGCWPPVHVAWRNSVTSVTFNTNTHQTVTVLPKAANKCVDQEWKYFLELGGFSGNRKQSRNVATLSVIPMQIKRCGKRPPRAPFFDSKERALTRVRRRYIHIHRLVAFLHLKCYGIFDDKTTNAKFPIKFRHHSDSIN